MNCLYCQMDTDGQHEPDCPLYPANTPDWYTSNYPYSCPNCGKLIQGNWVNCPYCGFQLWIYSSTDSIGDFTFTTT